MPPFLHHRMQLAVLAEEQVIQKGYWGCGRYTPTTADTDVDGIDFTTESAINPSMTLAVTVGYTTGISNEIKGMIGGGLTNTPVNVAEIQGMNFENETSNNPSATLALARSQCAGSNSPATQKGYWLGGEQSFITPDNEIDGFNFTSETAINPSATLSVARGNAAGVMSSTIGYAMGGNSTNVIDGINFSTEVAVNPSSTMPANRHDVASASSLTRGYLVGGDQPQGTNTNTIFRMIFSSEVTATITATLNVARRLASGVMSASVSYIGGGFTSGAVSEIDGFTFSSETSNNPSATLADGVRFGAGGMQPWAQN